MRLVYHHAYNQMHSRDTFATCTAAVQREAKHYLVVRTRYSYAGTKYRFNICVLPGVYLYPSSFSFLFMFFLVKDVLFVGGWRAFFVLYQVLSNAPSPGVGHDSRKQQDTAVRVARYQTDYC